MKIELALDSNPNIPLGAVLRFAPMRDIDDRIIGIWIIDDRSGEALDLVSIEQVRVVADE